MIAIIFRSRLTDTAAAEGYVEMAAEMLARAKEMPGFIDFKSFKADDGERLSLVYWKDHDTLKAWRNDLRHQLAQRLGREKWYTQYRIEVTEILRENSFERPG
jgi:heme-degrading monooxygenase HmoA